jgi:endoglucanase
MVENDRCFKKKKKLKAKYQIMYKLRQFIFIIVFVTLQLNSYPQKVSERIMVNQQGYYPGAPKIAVVTGTIPAKDFYITTTNLRDTFYAGKLSEEKKSSYSSTVTHIANFTSFKKKGSYVIVIPDVGNSYVFQVNNNLHRQVAIAALKGFYYWRSSIPLEFKYAGKWQRSAGHPDTAVLIHPSAAAQGRPAGIKISTPGGWYDAGDYNKYIVNAGITMCTLLSAYEDFPQYFKAQKTGIPESDDGVPDILNEVVYELRWMLSMQDPDDGGVYHKCTNAEFDHNVMPGVTMSPRYVVQKSTAATLDFAAVTAQCSRVFKQFRKTLPGLSDSCLQAAVKAWHWAQLHPALAYQQDKMNKLFDIQITTGEYGDSVFTDEWLWAASELFVSTLDNRYYNVLAEHIKDSLTLQFTLTNHVELFAVYTLLRNKEKLPSYTQKDIQQIKANLIQLADRFISKVPGNAFQTVMGQSAGDFIWGSNTIAANQGMVLIIAYLNTKEKKYIRNALTNLDYLMGRNATGYSFVTGFGSKSPMHPTHGQSTSDGVTEPVPGLLTEGPNHAREDEFFFKSCNCYPPGCHYEFIETETAYADLDCAYSSNEPTIDGQAPFVYLASAIEAMSNQF